MALLPPGLLGPRHPRQMKSSFFSQRVFIPLALLITLLLLWNAYTPANTDRLLYMMSRPFDVTMDLNVQPFPVPESSPPRIAFVVTNDYERPVTILRWDTVLDPLALQIGVISLTPYGTGQALDLAVIQLRRLMPPHKDQFITIMPGENFVNEIELKPPIVAEEFKLEGKTIEVAAKGKWNAVWPYTFEALSKEQLESIGSPDDGALRGNFETGSIEVEMP